MKFPDFQSLLRCKFFTLAKIMAAIIPMMFYIQLNFYLDQPRLNSILLKPLSSLNRSKRSGLIEPLTKEPIEIIELVPDQYWIYKRRATWNLSDELCQKDSRVLAAFVTKAEAILVIDKIYSISHFSLEYDWKRRKEEMGLDRNYWMGLFDLGHEGKWEWNHDRGFLAYQDMWTPHQPDHRDANGNKISNREQHCGGLWNPSYYMSTPQHPMKHTFDDKECTHQLYFICQNFGPLKPPPPVEVPATNTTTTTTKTTNTTSTTTTTTTTTKPTTTTKSTPKPACKACANPNMVEDSIPARCPNGVTSCREKNSCEFASCVQANKNTLLDGIGNDPLKGVLFCAKCIQACDGKKFPDVRPKCKAFCEKNKEQLYLYCYNKVGAADNEYEEKLCNDVQEMLIVKENNATSECKS